MVRSLDALAALRMAAVAGRAVPGGRPRPHHPRRPLPKRHPPLHRPAPPPNQAAAMKAPQIGMGPCPCQGGGKALRLFAALEDRTH
jgi:hypothetical protein